jgi:hypothetical protein
MKYLRENTGCIAQFIDEHNHTDAEPVVELAKAIRRNENVATTQCMTRRQKGTRHPIKLQVRPTQASDLI